MAYRRKTRRGKTGRKRRTNRRLSPHMVRAIKAISQGPVETKSYPYREDNFQNLLALSGYGGVSPSHIIRQNIYSDIPSSRNLVTKSEQTFIGDEIQSRGFRIQFALQSYSSVALQPDDRFRFSVYHENGYANGISTLTATNYIFDQDQTTQPTSLFWNPQIAKIIYRRTFTFAKNTQTSKVLVKKFWVPLKRKVTRVDEESVITASYMGRIKGEQYYWVLEIFSPGLNLTHVFGSVSSRIYFKDA